MQRRFWPWHWVPGAAQGLFTRLQQHEKLWGSLWLSDPAFQEASMAWQAAKAACNHAGV
jgi:hypothetical protein